jgi:DNA-binding transcriptional regulator YdaS (Cro superfamily)
MPNERAREPGLEIALDRAGGFNGLARALKLARSTVWQWPRIPVDPVNYVLTIEALYQIPRHELRPDVYPPPRRRGRPRKTVR